MYWRILWWTQIIYYITNLYWKNYIIKLVWLKYMMGLNNKLILPNLYLRILLWTWLHKIIAYLYWKNYITKPVSQNLYHKTCIIEICVHHKLLFILQTCMIEFYDRLVLENYIVELAWFFIISYLYDWNLWWTFIIYFIYYHSFDYYYLVTIFFYNSFPPIAVDISTFLIYNSCIFNTKLSLTSILF